MKTIKSKKNNIRLDKYLTEIYKEYSRTNIQNFINSGKIMVNNKKIKQNYKLKINDLITIYEDQLETEYKIVPKNLNIEIIYEDSDIAIINKPVDLIVHPSSKNENYTLVHSLKYQLDSLSSCGEEFRPGIVHRLDKNTSGIMIIAKTNIAYRKLVEQFKYGFVKRYYLAVVRGEVKNNSEVINLPLGRDVANRTKMTVTNINSKKAITKYEVIHKSNGYSLLNIELFTGRMHQIRVHMSYLNHPVVGDNKYSNNYENIEYQLLHAYKLGFKHPITNEYKVFKTRVPERINKFVKEVLSYDCESKYFKW